jgi:beta-glucanase (GH16 family)
MKTTKKASASLLLAALTIGILGIDASAVTAVSKPTKVAVVTTPTTATLTWTAFAKGKVTGVKIVASAGSQKITKTASATAKSFRFTGLRQNTSYAFSVYGMKGTRASAAVVVRAKTKVLMFENSIFFGQPDDMTLGDADQKLFALPAGGEVFFTTPSAGICEIVNGNYLKALALGECSVVASSPGDAQYAAAPSETRNVSITIPIDSLEKTLLWSEEFGGAAGDGPSSDNWVIETGDGCGLPPGCGWGNQESQSYAACAIKQDGNGIMTITASTKLAEPNCTFNHRNWTSGKFTTQGKKHFSYGYFEAKMKMPVGGGTWPAFWTLGSNIGTVPWPRSGELDIMEFAGNNPTRSTSAAHYQNNLGFHEYKSGGHNHTAALSNDFHTYGMLWLPNEVTFTFNGKTTFVLKKSQTGLANWPFGPSSTGVTPKMYLILNLAMGGTYGGKIASGYGKAMFDIDYVRYYSVSGYGSAPTTD